VRSVGDGSDGEETNLITLSFFFSSQGLDLHCKNNSKIWVPFLWIQSQGTSHSEICDGRMGTTAASLVSLRLLASA
jgi:hypothetical protein